jgi:hypothetical protein
MGERTMRHAEDEIALAGLDDVSGFSFSRNAIFPA